LPNPSFPHTRQRPDVHAVDITRKDDIPRFSESLAVRKFPTENKGL
jgi:hypothetical protein